MSTVELLENCFNDSPIGESLTFYWYATPIGIGALCKSKEISLSDCLLKEAIKEGLTVDLDLSKEERESHYSSKGLVLLFYS